mmetsp:Transcript_4904/g.18134  ORF Transcript_4904/g.18134 Transcript_4904/m.18134 type:complete len:766 (-) Transcript_4904:1592-3889(-)
MAPKKSGSKLGSSGEASPGTSSGAKAARALAPGRPDADADTVVPLRTPDAPQREADEDDAANKTAAHNARSVAAPPTARPRQGVAVASGVPHGPQPERYALETEISIDAENPKPAGTRSYSRYATCQRADTVGAYLALGGTEADLRWGVANGFITVATSAAAGRLAVIRAPMTLDHLGGDPPVHGGEVAADLDGCAFGANTFGAEAEDLFKALLQDDTAPANLRAAMDAPNQAVWVAALDKQVAAFEHHGTWRPVRRSTVSRGTRLLNMGIVLTVKRDGSHKARIYVAETAGSRPEEAPGTAGPHVPTRSSPTPGFTALKLLAAHAAHCNNKLSVADIVDAYLQGGRRDVPLLARWPHNWPLYLAAKHGPDRGMWPYDPDETFCEIPGNMPGAVDAGALWRATLHPAILALGFITTPLSEALYVKQEKDGTQSTGLVWTDDLVFSATDERAEAYLAAIHDKFPTKGTRVLGTDGGDLLAWDVKRGPLGGYGLSMATYERAVLAKLGFDKAASSKTPLPVKWQAAVDGAPAQGAPSRAWKDPQEALGFLSFAATNIRADLAFSTSALAMGVSIWNPEHDKALSRVLRYLNGSVGKSIFFQPKCELTLLAYADASLGGEYFAEKAVERAKSRIGGVIFFAGAPIYHFSVRTKTSPTSTFEAELIALVKVMRSLVIVRCTIMELFALDYLEPTVVMEDNQAVVQTLRKRVITGKARHVRLAIAYILDVMDAGHAIVCSVTTKEQLANMLTKAEPKEDHERSCAAFFAN